MNRLTKPDVYEEYILIENRGLEDAVKKLGAYEDTGLTPQKVAELVKAMENGRIKIMPCSVGDTVYEIRTTYFMNKYGGRIYDYSVCHDSRRLTYYPDSCYVKEKKFVKTDYTRLGKTVFLTKKEAQDKIDHAKKLLKEEMAYHGIIEE